MVVYLLSQSIALGLSFLALLLVRPAAGLS